MQAVKKSNYKKLLKKSPFLIAAFFIVYFVFQTVYVPLPSKKEPLLFYASDQNDNLLLLYAKALKSAKRSIHLSMYGLTDPRMMSILQHQADRGVKVSIFYDKSASKDLTKIFNSNVELIPVKGKGLMHKKILILDEKRILFGSANFTSPSLQMHGNTVIGIRNRSLSSAMQEKNFSTFHTQIENNFVQVWFLPNPKVATLLCDAIGNAKKTIRVAMFTLTHPKIVESLIEAKKRNVDVQVALDYHTANGASKIALQKLTKEHIPVFQSSGGSSLLHHKWAVIDEETLFLGSANWTKAAFNKNQDFLCQISGLSDKQQRWLKKLWNRVLLE